jgi:hypothetical protein
MKIYSAVLELLDDRQTDMAELTGALLQLSVVSTKFTLAS